jgi:hypothetical protein
MISLEAARDAPTFLDESKQNVNHPAYPWLFATADVQPP